MYLKKIVCQGFKSFADNIIIDLDDNITGIVGPNGSGKSNVVDAVRWVLGEQSVKSLRGEGTMTDVIFAGSKSRKPMNNASVSLIFDNSDNYLPISFDEVSIKRRLYIDGTNEFYLNGEKCRLKDITDLLSDSGIGKESFNIISQGKIDDILSSKPESRRIIFEDAARVSKYKKRKIEALKKLDKTHSNMDRIKDIINELDGQIEPLRQQKIKANEYFNLTDELKETDISLCVNDITNINYKYQNNKLKIDELNDKITSISTSNTKSESETSKIKIKLNDIEEQIRTKQSELLELVSKVEKLSAKKEIILERKKYEVDDSKLHASLVELKETELKNRNDVTKAKLELDNLNSKLKNINETLNSYSANIDKLKQEKNNINDNLSNFNRSLNTISIKIDSLRESIDNNSTLPFSVKNIIDNPKLRGIHNTIGSIIETEEEYSKAIATILGASANNIIVDNEICAKEAINYLKNNNLGRATFFPLNIIKPKYIDSETLSILKKNKCFINNASNLVKYDIKYKNIVENQLGNVIVCRNIDEANLLSKLINYRYRVVTQDGEVLHVGGALTGGNAKTRNIITDKYDLDKNIKLKTELINKIKIIEENINSIDYNLKSIEDKMYLENKKKIEVIEIINQKNSVLNELEKAYEQITFNISSTKNTLNKTIDIEEESVINEYYDALNNKEKVLKDIEKLNNQKLIVTDELEANEYKVKKDNTLYNELINELKSLEIDVNRADVKLDNLLNYLNETYSITYEKAASLYKLDIDEANARSKVNALKRKIKELGPINTLAPEEYEKVSKRYEFLIHQQEDLSSAENTLLEIINEMDEVMKNEFMKTFKVIQENFSITFKELFKGGHAELILTDPSNVLETGIEINACPPGKTLKSISLLSGGEKTFTAISLLFAILKSREVPFCILDEVEAALDEVNVDAFGEYITSLKKKTQFIVITHKKKTMEYTDTLYGITMQESGVSKLVSVKLEEMK